jgi:hypothetical protein
MESFKMVQLIADGVLALAIVFLVLYLFRLENAGRSRNREFMEQLEGAVAESRRASEEFLTLLERSRRALSELGEELDRKKKALDSSLDRAQNVLRPDGNRNAAGVGETKERDPYEQVMDMLEQGVPVKEIAGRTGLPENEIDLIVRLRGNRGKEQGA